MSATDIARAKGGDVFVFDYAHADVAETFTFDKNSWGLYKADAAISVTDAVRATDDGSFTVSVTLAHLDTFSSAHVVWDGEGFTVEYTLDGATWTPLAQYGVINLAGDPDFDIRVNLDEDAELRSLTVRVLATDTLASSKAIRTLAFSADPLINGTISIDTTMSVSTNDTSGSLPDTTGVQKGSSDVRIGTIEMWVTLNTGTTALVSPPAGTYYTNGVVGSQTAGVRRHVVYVLNSLSSAPFTVGPNMTVDHLAVYQNKMTADDVGNLYAANIGGVFRVDDPGIISLTEPATPTDIYAYAWSIVSGSPS